MEMTSYKHRTQNTLDKTQYHLCDIVFCVRCFELCVCHLQIPCFYVWVLYFEISLLCLVLGIFIWNVRRSFFLSIIQSNLDSSNTDGSFTMAYSNSFLSPYEILPLAK